MIKTRNKRQASARSGRNSERVTGAKRNRSSSAKNAHQAVGQVRIIGGDWRGRKLPVLSAEGLRPTSDRVRETLFNWLQFEVAGARCLDLFAGSGALGLEALSRGAKFVQFVEFVPEVARQLQQNLQTLKVEAAKAKISNQDALQWSQQTTDKAFDMVFLDPPFHKDFLPKILENLFSQGWINSQTCLYLEQENSIDWPDLPSGWLLDREKSTSQVKYGLFRFHNESE